MEANKKINLKDLLKMDLKDLKLALSKDGKNKNGKKSSKKKLPKKLLALDIGNNTIKFIVGKYEKDKIIIEEIRDAETPIKAVDDGKILDSENLEDIILYIIDNYKLKIKDIVYTTDFSSIMNRELLIPKVEEDEIDTVIRYEIQQFLPIDLNKYILQYTVLDEIENEMDGTIKYKVNVISYPEEIARSYYNLIQEKRIKPYALDVVNNSLKKLLDISSSINGVKIEENETIAFIDLGAQNINVNIYKNKKLEFTRMIKRGGNDIDEELANLLDNSSKTAEKVKIEKANLENINEDDLINKIIYQIVEMWVTDIGRFLQFYRNKTVGNSIDKVYIYGGSSNIAYLEEFMEERLNTKIEKIRSIDAIEFIKSELNDKTIEKYINAIGAIIRL